MEKSFWLNRWENNEIGFHKNEINPFLKKFAEPLLDKNSNVLVPLCGKSMDLLWLSERAKNVYGIEISGKAIECFFVENGIDFNYNKDTWFYSAQNIHLLEKDLLEVTPEEIGRTNLLYDRASIVALPPDLRKKYADKIISFAPEKILLVSLEYNQEQMSGPPFSVDENELMDLLGKAYSGKILETVDANEKRFQERGITSLLEKCYLFEKLA